MGFYVHTDMNFVVTERREDAPNSTTYLLDGDLKMDAGALQGAYEA